MKAKDYLEKYGKYPPSGDLNTVIASKMLAEITEVCDKRKAASDRAWLSAIRAQEQKFQAIRRLMPYLPENLFRQIIVDELNIAAKALKWEEFDARKPEVISSYDPPRHRDR